MDADDYVDNMLSKPYFFYELIRYRTMINDLDSSMLLPSESFLVDYILSYLSVISHSLGNPAHGCLLFPIFQVVSKFIVLSLPRLVCFCCKS